MSMGDAVNQGSTTGVGFVTVTAVAAAAACFLVALVLASVPTVPPGAAPVADEVRRSRNAAAKLAFALAADGTPRAVQVSDRDLDALATLANHGIDWLRVRADVDDGALIAMANLRLADRTWINVRGTAESSRGFPDVSIRLGAIEVPSVLVRGGLRVGDMLISARGYELAPLETMVRGFVVTDGAVTATLAVPRLLFRAARELLDSSGQRVDPELLRLTYGRLLADGSARPDHSFASHVRRAFAAPPPGADAVEYNRAALVALAMYAVGPQAGRLAGREVLAAVPPGTGPADVALGGRHDLAKHFALSAAMAAALDARFTRAIGEWKELDDSLPGGSGFSFVDLAADRAGLHLGRAAVDPATAAGISARLARASDAELFPAAARRLDEGLAEAQFRKRYGSLDAMTYAEAVARVDRLLAALPFYAPLIGATSAGTGRPASD
jgi:hypothetical protein